MTFQWKHLFGNSHYIRWHINFRVLGPTLIYIFKNWFDLTRWIIYDHWALGLHAFYDFWHIDPPYSKTAQYLKHENASALSRFVSLVFTFLRCWQSLSVVSQVLSIIWSEICDLRSEIRDMCGKVTNFYLYLFKEEKFCWIHTIESISNIKIYQSLHSKNSFTKAEFT